MNASFCRIAYVLLLSGGFCFSQSAVIERVDKLEQQGDFKTAASIIRTALADKNLTSSQRHELEFELDRLDRIKKDFPHTKEELFAELKKSVDGLTPAEFERWIGESRFDSREIDGKRYFMISSVSNLYFRYPELDPRRTPPRDRAKFEKAVWETVTEIKQTALAQGKPYVLPKRFQVTMTVTAKSNAAPAGETIRAWLPIPRAYPFQQAFELGRTSSTVRNLDGENSPIRCVYLEQVAQGNQPTAFRIEYEYTASGVKFDLKPDQVRPCDPRDATLKPFLDEAPHVSFTPAIRALSDQIAGHEKNPALKAKKFYDWIAGQIKYSYAIEYSTIRNISEYCRTKGYGDCGQEALLFISLCRLNGIPARWQSGWNIFPGGKTIHDWCEIYLAPYGWMPVDPYMGIFAMRYAKSLTPEQKRDVRDFYFGGLDQYRMAANGDHNQSLKPPKNSMRSDNVDFQRGELEWDSNNIYFDLYSWELTYKELKVTP
jgi:transglutaminase-like putative cysteine protease